MRSACRCRRNTCLSGDRSSWTRSGGRDRLDDAGETLALPGIVVLEADLETDDLLELALLGLGGLNYFSKLRNFSKDAYYLKIRMRLTKHLSAEIFTVWGLFIFNLFT